MVSALDEEDVDDPGFQKSYKKGPIKVKPKSYQERVLAAISVNAEKLNINNRKIKFMKKILVRL